MRIQEELKKLVEFQKFDLQIESAKKVLRFTPLDLKNLESDDLVVTTKLESLQWQLSDLEKTRTDLVNAIQSDTKLADQLGEKLSISMRHKEYHYTDKHIDKLRKLCKDRQLEIEKIDEHVLNLKTEIEKIHVEKKQIDTELEAKKTALKITIQERTVEINEAQKQKEVFKKQIDPTFMQRYERISSSWGHGVGVVKEKRCQSCDVLIPAQILNKLQKGDELLECPSCQRILYLPLQ